MKRKRIRYIGYYDIPKSTQNREFSPAATDFMTYLSSVIVEEGYDVEIVSMSPTLGKQPMFGNFVNLSQHLSLKTFFSIGSCNNICRRIDIHLLRLQMFLYLFFTMRKDDVVIVYHSLNYARLFINLRKVLNFRFILQVCEIYQDVTSNIAKKLKIDEYSIFNKCDAYIFSNDLLRGKIDPEHRLESVIIYGIYKQNIPVKSSFNDHKIHVVYAGTLDINKGGAAAAAAAAAELDSRFHIHILGFGGKKQIETIQDIINNHHGDCELSYEGLLQGEEFISFMRKCDIGLSTQIPNATFNDTSFPSKVLNYLSLGLKVVSVRMKALEVSKISDELFYINSNEAKDIAKGVERAADSISKSTTILSDLDRSLHTNIRTFISSIE